MKCPPKFGSSGFRVLGCDDKKMDMGGIGCAVRRGKVFSISRSRNRIGRLVCRSHAARLRYGSAVPADFGRGKQRGIVV